MDQNEKVMHEGKVIFQNQTVNDRYWQMAADFPIAVLAKAQIDDLKEAGFGVFKGSCKAIDCKGEIYFYVESNTFKCFECEIGGGPIQFLMIPFIFHMTFSGAVEALMRRWKFYEEKEDEPSGGE